MSERQNTNSAVERLYNGLIKENPTFVLMLGMCPTLAVTTSAINGLGMGLTTTAVLMMSNLIISLLRKVIPGRVRIPAFIVIIASFVTMVELLLEAYLPSLNKALGMYIPLIVVNCIILGRAESYAYSNPPLPSFFDGLGMGLGFSFALTCIGAVREFLSAGSLFGWSIMPESFTPISIFGLAPGAFFVLAILTASQSVLKNRKKKETQETGEVRDLPEGCAHDCTVCGISGCGEHGRFYDTAAKPKTAEPKTTEPEAAEPEKAAEEKLPEPANADKVEETEQTEEAAETEVEEKPVKPAETEKRKHLKKPKKPVKTKPEPESGKEDDDLVFIDFEEDE